jgi:glycine oxidase
MASQAQETILVLGGGLLGLAIAHGLARRGESVHVLSRRRSEAAGFVAAGMLAPHAEGLQGPLLALGQRSLELIPAWVATIEADSGLGCGLHPCGIVVPFASNAERDGYATAPWGLALDRSGLEQEVPGLAPHWQAGLLFAQDGQIDNRRELMRALEAACVARGVTFEEGSEVLELLTESKPPEGDSGQGRGRLAGVRLRRADDQDYELPCQRAVLACGAWSARLLPQLPLFPVKGQMLSIQGPRHALTRVLFGPGTYIVPRQDGLLVVGATSEPEAGFSEGLTPSGQKQLQEGLVKLLPEASSWPPMERWWGFRPCTADAAPLLGTSPIQGLWLASGHYRNGVLLAAVTVELLVGAMLGQNNDDDELIAAFGWNRFGSAPREPTRK